MNKLICTILFIFSICNLSAQDIAGFWKGVNEKTGKPQILVAIYPYEGQYFGRIIGTYNKQGVVEDTIYHPKDKAPGVKGDPFYSGLDFIVNLIPKGTRFKGKILDPQRGKWYNAELWIKNNGNLIVRGELLFFGRNQEWVPAKESDFPKGFTKPDTSEFIPKVPEVK